MMKYVVVALTLIVSIFLTSSYNKPHISTQSFEKGLVMLHIPKTAGMHLAGNILSSYSRDKHDFSNLGHVFLRAKPKDKSTEHKPVIVFLRDPLARACSMLRFTKSLVQSMKDFKLIGGPLGWIFPSTSHDFFNKVRGANFAHVADVKNLCMHMRGEYKNFWPGCAWSILAYTEYFAPPGLDISLMDDAKVDLCVEYALKNINFFGVVEDLEDSLYRLNLAFNLHVDPELARVKTNQSDKNLYQVDLENPEMKQFFDEFLVWEYKIYHKLLAAQRWKIAIPYVKTPQSNNNFAITQYTLPPGFDPDAYYQQNNRSELGLSDDVWERRKWAMLDFIEKNS